MDPDRKRAILAISFGLPQRRTGVVCRKCCSSKSLSLKLLSLTTLADNFILIPFYLWDKARNF